MPTDHVSYATLSQASQGLVAAAGEELLKSSFSFDALPGPGGKNRFTKASTALEQSFSVQRRPQRTIFASLGASASEASNDEVASSVGQLWRAGWRCDRDVAQHCLRFVREARDGLDGPFGEISGLRSYADFVLVLMEWHAELYSPEEVKQRPGPEAKAGQKRGRRQKAEGRDGEDAAAESEAREEVISRTVKRSRFFAAEASTKPASTVSEGGG
mmetsp:Transcript_64022/g.113880  ORF Transcript_64022/g.113880 Transcript_64022/m.113880 type:complete len:215 (+) Transcript_64022:42-686(+)|eukprot:CAMPEP_0197664090 /NCGR_PEP_ID=MMETSP1338-20131121/58426_1 /TAXON_ID=43686 ORGANISM="Pelagodinium beii, Strain RCC1491" /NCGR_SAMPLE_ID=MMETSP1338 /ASSEMBLY_ACC=CAM_ASM_000754 /LENGTH=214 /DNA_ID=CAMNT_0043242659 /DNA_START=42 /DNA_END=686 /DNA_ORIENTATION=+